MSQIDNYHSIRPSSRLLSAIGEDIIKDVQAAIVELVKNAYDADASEVIIKFSKIISKAGSDALKIVISDNGHGMSRDVVLNKWMVPATDDKLERRTSPEGRLMQGRKGIGRYAAAVLGDIMLLETIDKKGQKTKLRIDWRELKQKKFLDEIRINIESVNCTDTPGTKFTILGTAQKLYDWTLPEIENLLKELRKLISPKTNDSNDPFNVTLSFDEFPVEKYHNKKIPIQPFPLLELFDYRLSGIISDQGIAELLFENKSIQGIEPEKFRIEINFEGKSVEYCGPIRIDLRIFDRDPESIDNLIQRGVKDPDTGKYLGKLETRRLLDDICGIAVYRGNFRVRPHGDPGYDWLSLDERRVQDPSRNIGRNQVSGFVEIEREEVSHLEEKSARDGLKENKYYEGLKQIVLTALKQIENRRYAFRKKVGKGRKKVKIQKELDKLVDFTDMSQKIEQELVKSNVNREKINQIKQFINKTQEEKAREIETIRNEFAIYQGQATLGKIVMVLMHEGRKPLSWFNDQSEYIPKYAAKLNQNYDPSILERIIDRVKTYKLQSDILIKLFNKLEPLAIKKRGRKKKIDIGKVILGAEQVFEGELERNKIKVQLNCTDKVYLFAWEEDFYTALTNLFENSIYWLSTSRKSSKIINISVEQDEENLIIDFIDNGPGIDKQLMDDDILFDPGVSTKPDGSGLGLAIAGEAVERNGGTLKAINNDSGAYFRLEFKINNEGVN